MVNKYIKKMNKLKNKSNLKKNSLGKYIEPVELNEDNKNLYLNTLLLLKQKGSIDFNVKNIKGDGIFEIAYYDNDAYEEVSKLEESLGIIPKFDKKTPKNYKLKKSKNKFMENIENELRNTT
jgi:hypothetical protein